MDEEIKREMWNHLWEYQKLCTDYLALIYRMIDSEDSPYHKPSPAIKSGSGKGKNQPQSNTRRFYSSGQAHPVVQLSPARQFIQRFDSIKQAAQATNIPPNYISIAARTHSHTSDGSHWEFEENYEPPKLDTILFDASLPAVVPPTGDIGTDLND